MRTSCAAPARCASVRASRSPAATAGTVLDRLRLFANTPISDGDRPRLFAIVVALILGVVAALALLDDAGPSPRPASVPPQRDAGIPPPAPLPDTAPPTTPQTPSEESDPAASLRASTADVARSKRAARRFLKRYLPYAYGRASAEDLAAATPELREQLARERPRVPASERRRRARVELLQSDSVTRERAELLAVIEDGARRYTIDLQLANTSAGWLVISLER